MHDFAAPPAVYTASVHLIDTAAVIVYNSKAFAIYNHAITP